MTADLGGIAASATLSAIARCRHCGEANVMEVTILVNGRDVDSDAEVSGSVLISMPCQECKVPSLLNVSVPVRGDADATGEAVR